MGDQKKKNVNGSGSGLFPFTFESTGREIKVRKVSWLFTSALYEDYSKKNPQPKPPKQKVNYGDGDVVEENRAHPEFVRQLQEWETARREWVEREARYLYVELGVECEVDSEAVARVREAMLRRGVELETDDKFVYVYYVCIGSTQDYNDFVEAITRRSRPTEGEIAKSAESF